MISDLTEVASCIRCRNLILVKVDRRGRTSIMNPGPYNWKRIRRALGPTVPPQGIGTRYYGGHRYEGCKVLMEYKTS